MKSERLDRVLAYMAQENLEQILVTLPASVFYLTGLWVEPHERLLALYIEAGGQVTLYANALFGLSSSPDLRVVNHEDGSPPLSQLAAEIRPGRLGIDRSWSAGYLMALMKERPDMRPVLGSLPLDRARLLKDRAEEELLRQASIINDQVMASAISSLKAGLAENELVSQINRHFLSMGADGQGTQLVCFGPNGADPHHEADGSRLKPGDSVTIDIFTPINRYWCDMTRTVFYEKVSKKQREVYELVRLANEKAVSLVRPGIPLAQLDRAARDIISQAGYGPYFTHRLGHNIGLDCHESPDVSADSEALAQEGMVFSIEPGIYLPGEFGVRIEDLVLVTAKGCELLNAYPRDLQVIG